MSIPAAPPFIATTTPPSGDQATNVYSGTITGLGPTSAFSMYGAFNVSIYFTYNQSLTTTNGSASATVTDGSKVAAGQTVVSKNVPYGTTIGAVSTNTLTLEFPPGVTDALVVSGTDTGALFMGPFASTSASATIDLERSFDGGQTWITAGVGGGGTAASYVFGSAAINNPVSFVVAEPERYTCYRLNCRVYSAGTFAFRFSTNGLAAMGWGIQVG